MPLFIYFWASFNFWGMFCDVYVAKPGSNIFVDSLEIFYATLQRKKLKTKKKTQLIIASIFRYGGPTQGRTGNTRIFSPLLYLLSYRAII